jgi:RNA polymerase sigma-70 factor (ECF subfamily)
MLKLTLPFAKAGTVDRNREQALIQAAKRGDSEAFTELYNAYVDRIYHYIYARVSTVHAAEDLTGDVFVRVLEGLPTYEDRSTPILAWMYRIAHARVIDYYRRSRYANNDESLDTVQVGVEYDFDGPLMSNYETETVRTALRNLKAEHQEVIMLRFVEGYSLEMTAELLGKNITAIKSLQYRAVQALSRALQDLKPSLSE